MFGPPDENLANETRLSFFVGKFKLEAGKWYAYRAQPQLGPNGIEINYSWVEISEDALDKYIVEWKEIIGDRTRQMQRPS